MSPPPALIRKRKRNEVTADAKSQDATPPPKKATPEIYALTCCICRKVFTGAGHNPWGYIRRWWSKEANRYKSYRFRASRYGQVNNRCCAQCNTMVMKWRGQDGMPWQYSCHTPVLCKDKIRIKNWSGTKRRLSGTAAIQKMKAAKLDMRQMAEL
jgi:hypothetical protein